MFEWTHIPDVTDAESAEDRGWIEELVKKAQSICEHNDHVLSRYPVDQWVASRQFGLLCRWCQALYGGSDSKVSAEDFLFALNHLLQNGIVREAAENGDVKRDPLIVPEDIGRVLFFVREETKRGRDFYRGRQFAHPIHVRMAGGLEHPEVISHILTASEKELEKDHPREIGTSDSTVLLHAFETAFNAFLRKKEGQLEVVKAEDRAKNAIRVNDAQERYLQVAGSQCSVPFKTHRNLVLYFREEMTPQMDSFLFCWNYLIAMKYVSEGFSKVFDSVQVVSRYPGQYPRILHEIGLDANDYLPLHGIDFAVRTSVGANTVHFTHGSVHGALFGSHSILGLATRSDPRHMRKAGSRFVPVSLNYYQDNPESPQGEHVLAHERDYSGDLEKTVEVMFGAIRKLEDKMLREAGTFSGLPVALAQRISRAVRRYQRQTAGMIFGS